MAITLIAPPQRPNISQAFCRKFLWTELMLWPQDLPRRRRAAVLRFLLCCCKRFQLCCRRRCCWLAPSIASCMVACPGCLGLVPLLLSLAVPPGGGGPVPAARVA